MPLVDSKFKINKEKTNNYNKNLLSNHFTFPPHPSLQCLPRLASQYSRLRLLSHEAPSHGDLWCPWTPRRVPARIAYPSAHRGPGRCWNVQLSLKSETM